MTWNATEKTARNLTLEITFAEAYKVSASFNPEVFRIIFNDPLLCYSARGGIIAEKNRLLTKNMPRQLPQSGETTALEVIVEVMVVGAKAVFVSNFVLNFFLTAALQ